jgi:hypothetical protein
VVHAAFLFPFAFLRGIFEEGAGSLQWLDSRGLVLVLTSRVGVCVARRC